MKRWIVASDLHGDMQDAVGVAKFLRHVAEFRPHVRGFAGDIWDCRPLRAGASKPEKLEHLQDDFDAGMEFIEQYRPTFITLGNHDARLWDWSKGAGPLADYCSDLIWRFFAVAEKLKCRVIPYDKRKVYRLAKNLAVGHGWNSGVNACREYAKCYGNILVSHGHAIDAQGAPGLQRRTARMIGCLCRLDMDYNRAQVGTLRQSHGWAYGPILRNGNAEVFQAQIVGGKVVAANGFKVI
jgi:hypothetical protein